MKKLIAVSLALATILSAGSMHVLAASAKDAAAPAVLSGPVTGSTFQGVILGVGSNESERNMTWSSNSSAPGKLQIAKKVDLPNGDFSGEGWTAEQYNAESAVIPGLAIYSNQVTVKNLEPNTEYVYRVGDDSSWSQAYTFSTKGAEDFSFLFAGDPQIGASGNSNSDTNSWNSTLSFVQQNFADASFLLSAGDQVNTYNNVSQYDGYLNPILSTLTNAVTVGNHDSSVGRDNNPYLSRFAIPNLDSRGATDAGGDYWYTYNNVLFMDINSNNRSTAEHKAFMEDAIAQNPDVTWKVVVFHHSVYSVASHAFDGDILERRDQLVPVFSELGIDVALMGHDHVYTRSYMMNGTTPDVQRNEDGTALSSVTNPSGTLYLTANSASGSKFYTIQQSDFPFAAVQNQERVPNITNIQVTDTSFRMTTYRVSDGSVVDDFTINKTSKGAQSGGNTEVTADATIDPSYTFSIPATVDMGSLKKTANEFLVTTPFSISVTDLVKASATGKVDVTVAPSDASRTFRMINADDNQTTLGYQMKNANDVALSVGGLFATFTEDGSAGGSVVVDASQINAAGQYAGTVTFTASYGE